MILGWARYECEDATGKNGKEGLERHARRCNRQAVVLLAGVVALAASFGRLLVLIFF